MPRPNNGPKLVLYGPDTRHGARRRAGFRDYVWYVVWSERGAKRERSAGTRDRTAALNTLRQVAEDLTTKLALPEPSGPRAPEEVMIGDVLSAYGGQSADRVADPGRIGSAIARLAPFWGSRTVAEISEATLSEYAKLRRADFAASEALRVAKAAAAGRSARPARTLRDATLRRELVCLRAALNYAREKAKSLASVPYIELPPDSAPRESYLTRPQVARLLRAARKSRRGRRHLPLFILVAFYTGARRTAILRLRWSEHRGGGGWVDLERGVIDFLGYDEPTKKRRVRIPIPERLMTFLRLARARTKMHVFEFEGEPIGDVKTALASAARTAGLGRVVSHMLKHTAITYLLQRGVSIWAVSGWTGTSVETIRDVYGHHAHERTGEVRTALR